MQRLAPLLVTPLLLCAALTACSSSGSGAAGGTPSSPAPAPTTSSALTSAPAPTTSPSTTTSAPAPVTSSAAAASEPAAAAGTITFTGKFSGSMTVRDCQGGIAQLDVDIDGAPTTYAGIIDADDFTFVAPNSAGFTLAKGVAAPKVSNGGKTFTVHDTKLIGVLSDDTVTATGSVTCP